MLGSAVIAAARAAGHNVQAPPHSVLPIERAFNAPLVGADIRADGLPEVIINCAGRRAEGGLEPFTLMQANASGPHSLAIYASRAGAHLVHISTDCVFDGQKPPPAMYSVEDVPAPESVYGASKRAGEVGLPPDTLIIRTSFIGFRHGLLAWYIREATADRRTPAWTQAWWSGSTAGEVARAVVSLATDMSRRGVEHLATAEPISKDIVLELTATAFNLLPARLDLLEYGLNRALRPSLTVTLPSLTPAMIRDEALRDSGAFAALFQNTEAPTHAS